MIRSFADKQAIRARHNTKHHFEGGLAWSSCSCGWESGKLDSYHSYQMQASQRAGSEHVRFMENTEEV